MRIATITGGRRDDRGNILIPSPLQMRLFIELILHLSPDEVRHGKAIGTDRYIDFFLRAGSCRFGDRLYLFTFRVNPFPVLPEDGPWPYAGHRRNARMLQSPPRADTLIAFPGGGGTANCVETALGMGISVWQWEGDRERGEFREIAR